MAVWSKIKEHLIIIIIIIIDSRENHIINVWTSGFLVVSEGSHAAVEHIVYLLLGRLFLDQFSRDSLLIQSQPSRGSLPL